VFSSVGATSINSLTCGTEYHFIQSFTNSDDKTATSSDATFTTSDCTGGSGGGGGGGGSYTFPDGDGSVDNPYAIESCEDLAAVNDYLDQNFILETDLDCSVMGNDVMIGSFGLGPAGLTGIFDGGGHSVKVSLEAEEPAVGLFRSVFGGTIRNLAIAPDSFVLGEEAVGSLVGVALDATLQNVGSAATVVASSPTPDYPLAGAGGIVGGLYSGSIDGAEFTGIVGAPTGAGGITAIAFNDLNTGPGAIISRSDSTGQVFAGFDAGGIAGVVGGGAQVRNSYSSASVAYYPDFTTGLPGTGAFGGIVGGLDAGTISRSYASGEVVGGVDSDLFPSGGLVGYVTSGDAIIVHSFAAGPVTSSGGPVGAFIGGADESDGPFAGLFDDFYDTERTGKVSCGSDTSYDGCMGVDGSTDGYWLGTEGTPLAAWNQTTVWDTSGDFDEFPLLRLVSGAIPDESDEFIRDDGGEDTTPPPPHHSAPHKPPSKDTAKPTIASLETQLAALAAQYRSLLSPSAGTPGIPSRDLAFGASGDDVRALQAFLIEHGYPIAAGATGYFGAQTRSALAAYQEAHGIVPAAGYFGPLTRTQMTTVLSAGT
jgi:hypothetical protein